MNVQNIVEDIIMTVYNQLGYGLSESAYQRAMELEIESRGYGVIREYYLNETFKDKKGRTHVISQLRVDLLIMDLDCVIELKTISKLGDKERAQINRYKKLSCCRWAFLVNFGKVLSIEIV